MILYDDYFLYDTVFRFEVEYLTKFNKKENWASFTYKEIFIKDIINIIL